ncbi:MAG: hypothetical protein ABI837_00570 [Acidobacteriota bacterium]
MALFLDAVYNDLGPEGNYLSEFAPYFTDRYKTQWGLALNFDGQDSDHVRWSVRKGRLEEFDEAYKRGSLEGAKLLRRWSDGRVKLFVTWRAMEARNRHATTFRRGAYRAVDAGPNAVAFTRGDDVLVVAPRLTTKLGPSGHLPLGEVWGDAVLEIGGRWTNAFTGEVVEGDRLALAKIFASFPVAVLEPARPAA